MALTRNYKETVLARIKRDPKFARALYAEALDALLTGETEEGLSMLRDLEDVLNEAAAASRAACQVTAPR